MTTTITPAPTFTAHLSTDIDRNVEIPGMTGLFSVRTVRVDIAEHGLQPLFPGSHTAVLDNGVLIIHTFHVPLQARGQELALTEAASNAGWQPLTPAPLPGRPWGLAPLASGARSEHLLDRAEQAVLIQARERAAWEEREAELLNARTAALVELKAGARTRVPDLARRIGVTPSRVHNMARQGSVPQNPCDG